MAKNLAPLNRTTSRCGWIKATGTTVPIACPARTDAEHNWNALAAIDAPAAEVAAYCQGCGQSLSCCKDKRRHDYIPCCVACFHPLEPEPANAQVPATKPPLDYWARVLDTAVEELHLLSGDNPPRGRSVMPLTVTLTTMAMHIRNGSVMPTPATPEANAQGSGARTDPDAYAIRTDDPIVASPASAPPHSPLPFTAEEARGLARAEATMAARCDRDLADDHSSEILERAAEEHHRKALYSALAQLRSVLQRAKESR